MDREEKVGFLRWVNQAKDAELEKHLVQLHSLTNYLTEEGARSDARWMIGKIKSEMDARREVDRT